MRATLLSLLASAATCYAQTPSLAQALASSPQLSNLTSLLSGYPGFVAALSNATNVTILAPSNDAFAKLAPNGTIASAVAANDSATIEALVEYHVLNGTYNSSQIMTTPSFVPTHLTNSSFTNVTTGQRVEAVNTSGNVVFYSGLLQNSTVTQANVAFSGGIIHVIDTFLTPPADVTDTALALGLTATVGSLEQGDIGDVYDTLSNITIFAPTNDAFQAIGSVLQNVSTMNLGIVDEYHIINGTVAYSTDIMNMTVPTLQGTSLTLSVVNGSVFVNQAKVVLPNVLVANGVMHVIDGVLNPNASAATPDPTAATASAAFPGGSSISAVPFTTGVPVPSSTLAVPSVATAAAGAGATASGSGSGSSKTSAAGAAKATAMGIVGAGALFAGAWMGL